MGNTKVRTLDFGARQFQCRISHVDANQHEWPFEVQEDQEPTGYNTMPVFERVSKRLLTNRLGR
jgi:hypothetical protein